MACSAKVDRCASRSLSLQMLLRTSTKLSLLTVLKPIPHSFYQHTPGTLHSTFCLGRSADRAIRRPVQSTGDETRRSLIGIAEQYPTFVHELPGRHLNSHSCSELYCSPFSCSSFTLLLPFVVRLSSSSRCKPRVSSFINLLRPASRSCQRHILGFLMPKAVYSSSDIGNHLL